MKTTTLQAERRNLDYDQVQKNLTWQLKGYIENETNADWYVIWVSGWVDSGLVSTLCAETNKILRVLSMPIHQKPEELDRASEHIEWLQEHYANVTSDIIDLTGAYEALRWSLAEWTDEYKNKIADANLRSRLRANVLYDVANRNNLLVAGTWNLVEDYWVGFFTKFGDGAVDVSPIWELYKHEVRELADHLWVNQEVVTAIATDGLHTDWATDEDQIGANYDELERALQQYDHWFRENNYEGRAAEVMKIYTQRHEANAHKMDMPPVFSIDKEYE